MSLHLPSSKEVGNLLSSLLEKTVVAESCDEKAEESEIFTVSDYIDDDDNPAAFCTVEFSVAVGAAGALAMFPAGAVKEALDAGKIDDVLEETTREVMNVLVQLLHMDSNMHVRLGQVNVVRAGAETPLPDEPSARSDIAVMLDGAFQGRISFLLL